MKINDKHCTNCTSENCVIESHRCLVCLGPQTKAGSLWEALSMRQVFENWYCDGNKRAIERSGDGYKLMQAHSAWTTWQAATSITASRINGLEADNEAKQALIENFKLDDLMAIFTKELEKQIVLTFDASRAKALSDAIEAVDAAGGDNEDYHIGAIKRKFGSEI
jgi:hypothetical protein